MKHVILNHLDLWIGAVTKKSSSGRGSNGKVELTGVKRLRAFILELALRGKLTEQLPTDEPAQQYLKRVKTDRKALGEGPANRKGSATSPVDAEPFSIPKGWSWERLGDIGLVASSRRVRQRDWQDHGIPFFRAREIVKLSQHGHVNKELFISENLFSELAQNGHIPEVNDLMLTGVGTIGVPYIVKQDDKFYFKDASVLIFKNFLGVCPQFLYYFCHSPFWKKSIHKNSMGTTVHTLTITRANQALIPVAPIEEQHRIVQKVDELMTLCDRLEQQTSDQLEAHETLVDTLLGTLIQSENATELADNWARLAAHFDALFTTEQSIDKLKQTLLQLAVMGRLVEQDAGDEPTESMVTKIDQEITSLVKQGQIKKPKPTPEISDNDKLFKIPNAWQWVRLGSLALHSEAGWSPKCHDAPRVSQSWAVLKVSAVTWGEFRPGENKELPSNLTPRPEYEVHPSDFLISRANTSELVARSVVVPKGAPTKLMMSDKIIRFVFSDQVEPLYINLFNNSPFARSYYLSVAGGTSSSMKNVSRAQIQALAVPLPSRTEQTRIVQKVDELMTLCDQLKERLNQASETRRQLADAVVEGTLG